MKKEVPITFLVEKSKIKELAEECPEYKHAMEVLFPEAFKVEVKEFQFQIGDIVSVNCHHHRDSKIKTGTALGSIKLIHPSMRLSIGVEFFHSVGGHSLNDFRAASGHGWWHAPEDVMFVFRPAKVKGYWEKKEKQL